ncbi:hypothetical protein BDW74DRAFT_71017 [Aspergillus multicolor]|uniref:putative R3H and G-patch domain protein n=1 Tax=Aspergillus multicolor TaxID=41759 RepID=UPI003CCE20AC
MQQEARNTEGRNLWRLNLQLRHQAVQFVSAGSLEPTNDKPAEPAILDSQHPIQTQAYSPEDSSEDEVVFRGRRRRSESDGNPMRFHSQALSPDNPVSDWIPIRDTPTKSRSEISDENAILADYIAHIADDSSDDDDGEDDEPASDSLQGMTDGPFDSDYHDMSPIEELDDFILSHKEPDNSVFASATAFADALEQDPYYGLDIMDFSRSKKKKGLPNLDALDSELEDELINAWNNDRLKKKSKKREREKLRTQGLLGRRGNDPDLKLKYTDGINIDDLKSEIRSFLLSSKNSLSLPPMTKHRRILIHDTAHALRLTSQSRGKGSSRFPVLSKTSRTPKYTSRTILQIDRVFSNPRAIKAWDKTGGKTKRGHGNVSYMDGDVVGASAPEIGIENKGRAMLEKMGWSTGTALGATNNKGILLPVAHVVKNSKAGLG